MTNYDLMKEIHSFEELLFRQAKQAAESFRALEPNKTPQQLAKLTVKELNGDFFTTIFDGVELGLWLYLEEVERNEKAFTKGA